MKSEAHRLDAHWQHLLFVSAGLQQVAYSCRAVLRMNLGKILSKAEGQPLEAEHIGLQDAILRAELATVQTNEGQLVQSL